MLSLEKLKASVGLDAKKKRVEDLRSVVRHPQRMKGGFIYSDPMIFPREVVIKDLSVKGARIQVTGEPITAKLVVEGFVLYMASEKHEIPCSLAWMKGQMLGLKFQGKPRRPSRVYK